MFWQEWIKKREGIHKYNWLSEQMKESKEKIRLMNDPYWYIVEYGSEPNDWLAYMREK